MAELISIRPKGQVHIEMEKQEPKKNILYLMMVLIGVRLAEMIDDSTEASTLKIERLKALYDQNKKQIETLLTQLDHVKVEMERLKSDSSTLPELQTLKHELERLQNEYHHKMMEGAQIQNELTLTAKIEITPIQMVEALQNIAKRFLDAGIHQMGNQIKFK